jgi:hypothetical protein
MSSALLVERPGAGTFGFGGPAIGAASTAAQPGTTNWCVLPRCEMKFEKCAGGCKITCQCDDEVACATLQNLCKSLAGGLCSCCCTCNGIPCCQCNFALCHCQCECTKSGVCITCTTGDKACCDMIQACCECLAACCKAGCCCYLCFNNTPVCCSTC